MATKEDLNLSETEKEALHEVQLATEHVYHGFGDLISFHHKIGHAMDKLATAESLLRESGHGEFADELRERHLPAGAVDDMWTYEIVETFRHGFLSEIDGFDDRLRSELAEGQTHVTEREQQDEWRERVDWSE